MMTVVDANTTPIVIALLIGLLVGWWIFKRGRGAPKVSAKEPVADTSNTSARYSRSPDGPEGNNLVDQGAAATADVAGQILGVEVHAQLPGADGPPDNLQLLKGVGPKLAANLNANGVIRFDQLARLSPNEIAILDEKLGAFKGRLARDRVPEQASYLARGDTDGFEAKFGKLGSDGQR